MCSFFLKTFVAFLIMCSSHAYASGMINNTAFGYVGGSIVQTAEGQSINSINVGSIVGTSVRNTNVSATVQGDIFVQTTGKQRTVLNIGSVIGR